MPNLTRIHKTLWKTFSKFCIVNKKSTLHFKRFSGYRWHTNIFSSRYLIEYWITRDCNKFNCMLFILRHQTNWETISKCQLRTQDGSWIFVLPNSGVSDLKNSTNYSVEYESKNNAVFSMPLLHVRVVFRILYDHVKCFFFYIVH